jgi:hypothetical protein
MTKETRTKAIRCILDSLTKGEFSESELEEISRALIRGNKFAMTLALALRSSGQESSKPVRIKSRPRSKKPPFKPSQLALQAMELIQKYHITQKELLSIMGGLSPELAVIAGKKRWRTIQLVDYFLSIQNKDKGTAFINELKNRVLPKPSYEGDSYLDFITKKLDK